VEDHPLALCDPKSVNHSIDLIATDRVGSSYVGEVYYLKHNPKPKWYWLRNQKPNELALFISFDSSCGSKPNCEPLHWNEVAFNSDGLQLSPTLPLKVAWGRVMGGLDKALS